MVDVNVVLLAVLVGSINLASNIFMARVGWRKGVVEGYGYAHWPHVKTFAKAGKFLKRLLPKTVIGDPADGSTLITYRLRKDAKE